MTRLIGLLVGVGTFVLLTAAQEWLVKQLGTSPAREMRVRFFGIGVALVILILLIAEG